jgi:hypothetical protein
MNSVSGTEADEEAARFVLKYWAQEIVEGQIDVLTGSRLMYRDGWFPLGQPSQPGRRHATAADPDGGVYYCPETP